MRACLCGHESADLTEHGVHVSTHTRAELAAMRRPISCWRCATDIPNVGERICPACGWKHPGFGSATESDR